MILLRPLSLDDAETISDWAEDPLFVAHAGWTPGVERATVLAFWTRLATAPPPDLLRLAAVHDGEIVGCVDLHGSGPTTRELGFEVGPSARWGQGLGTALARAGLDHGFEELGLEEIWAEALPANAASVRILERLGMRRTGSGNDEEFLGEPGRYSLHRITQEEHARLRDRGAAPTPAADPRGTAR
ncbi:GNAT family protein [Brachybacterium sacelli]